MWWRKRAYEECRTCGAEYVGTIERDEDGNGFLDFGHADPFSECSAASCLERLCQECESRCVECNATLCETHGLTTDEGTMCRSCAAEYDRTIAEEIGEERVA